MIRVLHPLLPTADRLLPYLKRIDETGQYVNFGPLEGELCERLANRREFKGRAIVTVANGTLALELYMKAIFKRCSRVLIPSLTFPATAQAVYRARCVPVFGDIDPHTWCLPPAEAIGADIEAAVPVCAFGGPVDQMWKKSTKFDVLVDAAAAFGSYVPEGVDAVYSMHATKVMSAGEGAFIVTSDECAERIRMFTNFGRDEDGLTVLQEATNGKLSEYHCAVALAMLDSAEERAGILSMMHDRYRANIGPDNVGWQSGAIGFPRQCLVIRVADAALAQKLMAKDGVETRRWYYPPLHRHPAFMHVAVAPGGLYQTERMAKQLIGLPLHPRLSACDIDKVCESLNEAIKRGA